MKMNIRPKPAFALIIACFALCFTGVTILETGCGTTPETKIAQGAQLIIHGVNDGMAEWTLYVNAGKAKQSQINTVKQAYNGYYAAGKILNAVADKMAAKDPATTTADLDAANAAVKTAESALLTELASIMNAVISTK